MQFPTLSSGIKSPSSYLPAPSRSNKSEPVPGSEMTVPAPENEEESIPNDSSSAASFT